MARAEIHFHLLPGVDDGPSSLEESLALAHAAEQDGTDTVVATPHVSAVDVHEIGRRCGDMSRALEQAGIALRVVPGGEVAARDLPWLGPAGLAAISVGPAHARWVLMEAVLGGSGGDVKSIHTAADRIRQAGYGLVLAHPERNRALTGPEGDEALDRELELGTVLQVNGASLVGGHGAGALDSARHLVQSGRAGAVSSDAHSLSRPPVLSLAFGAVAALAGERVAHRLVEESPRHLVEEGLAPR